MENARLCLPMQRVCVAVRKMKSQMKFLGVTFFISDNMNFMHKEEEIRCSE